VTARRIVLATLSPIDVPLPPLGVQEPTEALPPGDGLPLTFVQKKRFEQMYKRFAG
jgi:hypothetical protein